MGERKHTNDVKVTKAAKHVNEEERLPGYHAADALRQVTDGPPSTLKPAQILTLQRTVGNKVVQKMLENREQQAGPTLLPNTSPLGNKVQRHPEDTASFNNLKDATNSNLSIFHGAIIKNKDAINTMRDVHREDDADVNKTFRILAKWAESNSDRIRSTSEFASDNAGRIANLESRSGGG